MVSSESTDATPHWQGDVTSVAVPACREVFVNTPLTPLGPDENGAERFWITSYNRVGGSLGVCINEHGEHRFYRFPEIGGLYSICQEDADTLWLCGLLNNIYRLELSTGNYEHYETGAPHALVFAGMPYDAETGRICAFAHPPNEVAGFTFDIRERKAVAVHHNVGGSYYMRSSFPNGDGTWTIIMHTPGLSLLHWEPKTDTFTSKLLLDKLDTQDSGSLVYRVTSDEDGRYFFPGLGWYVPATQAFEEGPTPSIPRTWFGRHGRSFYGVGSSKVPGKIVKWDLDSGTCTSFIELLRGGFLNVAVGQSGDIFSVTGTGDFYRLSGQTGELLCRRRLPAFGVQDTDCMVRINKRRLLGTPFITQRFWEADLETGEGVDCGAAAAGTGEVLRTWKIDKYVYMAEYTGGTLVKYDPDESARFPENPHTVAAPPGAMRPVADATDGRYIYYSCSHNYGTLGSIVTRYDTVSGGCQYSNDPFVDLQIRSLALDTERNLLFCGSNAEADCGSCPPSRDMPAWGLLTADGLERLDEVPGPPGSRLLTVAGPMSDHEFLGVIYGDDTRDEDRYTVILSAENNRLTIAGNGPEIVGYNTKYAGVPGFFLFVDDNQLYLWDLNIGRRLARLCGEMDHARYFVQDKSILKVRLDKVTILEDALADWL